jgi:hypothetical protein
MDDIAKGIQRDIFWSMLFANDVVLIDKNGIGVNQKLELWRNTLKLKGFRLRTKTEYMRSQFSWDNSNNGNVSLEGQIVSKNDTFQ